MRVPIAVERSPPTTSAPAGSRISDRDTAVNDRRSVETVTVAFTFVVPRYAPVAGLNRKNNRVIANTLGPVRAHTPWLALRSVGEAAGLSTVVPPSSNVARARNGGWPSIVTTTSHDPTIAFTCAG